ncbi:vacuolar protein sorting-associated protein 62 [[Candida] railenensis]|uniref:Vacuolar protein sorting-associated protein 62 n=1 Tax=[Candida] railenensis TaxID=45579 RepID=A0A9P0QRY4_9ASCO|nr:vacuolar protein sorting-associated protein 62 [[Candida] railenensis]
MMKLLLISVLSFSVSKVVASALPSWDVQQNSYIINAINSEQTEIDIQNVFRSPINFPDFPKIQARPKKKDRTTKEGEIPQYVVDFAPFVYLYSEEAYLPCDIADFVSHTHAVYDNGTVIDDTVDHMNLTKLANLPKDKDIFLTSNDDFSKDPEWITGSKNKPSLVDGEIPHAPATLIVVDKGNGWVDSFWFYFYAFNLGPFVSGAGPYGNHVGDWEHSLVRFYKGKPIIVWLSAHGGGGAYYFPNLEKSQTETNHPIIFSARGTHANYVSVGQHPHDLPYDILSDFTDRGPLWNPSKNYLGYTYDGKKVTPVKKNSNAKHVGRELEYDNWLSFIGHWGDKQLPLSDPRQYYSFIAGYHQIDGPTGPLTKNLLRLSPCERGKWWNFWQGCNIRQNIKWGVGMESEGYNCGNIFINVRPKWFKSILDKVTWGGGFCYIVDLILG